MANTEFCSTCALIHVLVKAGLIYTHLAYLLAFRNL